MQFTSSLKKTKVKLELSTDINILLMVEKGIRGIYQYTETNNKYMKDYHSTEQSSYFIIWDVNNCVR